MIDIYVNRYIRIYLDQRALVCASELCDRLEKSSPPRGIYDVAAVATRRRAPTALRTDPMMPILGIYVNRYTRIFLYTLGRVNPDDSHRYISAPEISSLCVCAHVLFVL